jgi:hypothetical protein
MITVGNKTHGAEGIYVGRPSPLGEPFPIQRATCAAVIRDGEDWLTDALQRSAMPTLLSAPSRLSIANSQGPCIQKFWKGAQS